MKTSNKLLLLGCLFFVALILSLAVLTCSAKRNNQNQVEGDRFSLALFKTKVLGDQKIVKKDFALAALKFSKIALSVPGDVVINVTGGDQPTNVAEALISCDSNLLPYIKVYAQDDTLFFARSDNVRLLPSQKISIVINVDSLKAVVTRGATNVSVNNLKGENFYAELKGAGHSKFHGKVNNFAVTVNGASDVDAHQLEAENVRVKIQGAGEVLTYATKSIDIDISGAGSVGYYGDPKNITRSLHGFGVIKALKNDKTNG